MPALPSVAKAVRVLAHYTLAGVANPIINSFHWGYTTGDVSASDVLAFANLWASAWATDMAPVLATALELSQVHVTSLSSPSSPSATITPAHTGGNALAPNPAGVAVIEQRPIARRYRGGHSRVYWPGTVFLDLADPDTWTSAFTSGFEAALGAFAAAIVAGAPAAYGAWFPINISYYHGFTNFLYPSGRYRAIPTLRGTPLVDPILPGPTINPKPGSQRRRYGQSA